MSPIGFPPLANSAGREKRDCWTVSAHLVREGFRNSGIRALANSVGISDRMLMYYFDTKEELIEASLLLIAEGLSAGLETALPDRSASGARIVSAIVDSTITKESRPVLELWFEVVGLAVRGNQPYKKIAQLFLDEWERWIASKLKPEQQHRAPELLAQIEGAIMVKLLR